MAPSVGRRSRGVASSPNTPRPSGTPSGRNDAVERNRRALHGRRIVQTSVRAPLKEQSMEGRCPHRPRKAQNGSAPCHLGPVPAPSPAPSPTDFDPDKFILLHPAHPVQIGLSGIDHEGIQSDRRPREHGFFAALSMTNQGWDTDGPGFGGGIRAGSSVCIGGHLWFDRVWTVGAPSLHGLGSSTEEARRRAVRRGSRPKPRDGLRP